MIHDKLSNYKKYFFSDKLQKAFEHSLTLSKTAPTGIIKLDGDNLFVSIQEYNTRPLAECKPETHRNYIDIQILLSGEEYILWYPENSLTVSEPYNPDRDVEFYKRSGNSECCLKLEPGVFSIFYPWDIHTPQILFEKSAQVKKAVYKVRV